MRTSTIIAVTALAGVGVWLVFRPAPVATASQQKGDSGQSALGTARVKGLRQTVFGLFGSDAFPEEPGALAHSPVAGRDVPVSEVTFDTAEPF